jgi:hypothetical protein
MLLGQDRLQLDRINARSLDTLAQTSTLVPDIEKPHNRRLLMVPVIAVWQAVMLTEE